MALRSMLHRLSIIYIVGAVVVGLGFFAALPLAEHPNGAPVTPGHVFQLQTASAAQAEGGSTLSASSSGYSSPSPTATPNFDVLEPTPAATPEPEPSATPVPVPTFTILPEPTVKPFPTPPGCGGCGGAPITQANPLMRCEIMCPM